MADSPRKDDEVPSSSSAIAKRPATPLAKKEVVKAKKVRSLFVDVAEELSKMCRLIEKWTPDAVDAGKIKERKKKLKENMKKTNKKLRKLNQAIPLCDEFQNANLPISLIEHLGEGRSPNTWMKDLLQQAEAENEQARGEFQALGVLHSTLASLVNVNELRQEPPKKATPADS